MRVLVLVLVTLAVTSLHAQSGKVSGTLVLNGKKVPIPHITAVSYDTPSPGRLVSVLVSDKPADPKTFREYTRIGPGERLVAGMITGAWVTMHIDDNAFSGFSFTIDTKRRIILNDVLVGPRDDNFSVPEDSLIVELTSLTPRVAGRVRTKEPVLSFTTGKIGIDLTFDAPVVEVGK